MNNKNVLWTTVLLFCVMGISMTKALALDHYIYLEDGAYEIVGDDAQYSGGSEDDTYTKDGTYIEFESERDGIHDEVQVIFYFTDAKEFDRITIYYELADCLGSHDVDIRFYYESGGQTDWMEMTELQYENFYSGDEFPEGKKISAFEVEEDRTWDRFSFRLDYTQAIYSI